MKNPILADIEQDPCAWELRCPKCGSTVNGRYALALAPMLGVTILPYFYCHCTRFQVMEPTPIRLSFTRRVLILRVWLFDLFGSMTKSYLRRRWS